MTAPGYILTLDAGSSSVRCALYDERGEIVEGTASSCHYGFASTQDGGSTLDADELSRLACKAIDASLAQAGQHARSIAAVSSSTFWHSVLGVDAQGYPTTPIFGWGDRRAADAARELSEQLDEADVHRRTGCMLHSSYLPAKLLWLSRSFPEAFRRTERFLSPGEYLHLKLFGETSVSTSMASGTGLFDQNRRVWYEQLLNALPVSVEQLSSISDEPSRGLQREWARRWPALAEVPWFPAAGDGACSNIGSGCVSRNHLALMVGTSGALRVLWKANRTRIPEGLWCYRADERRFVSGGALSDGGNLVDWLRATLRLPAPEEAEKLLSEMEPNAHGLTFLPLLAGERGPGWVDRANGAVAGLSMATAPIDLLRAAMEAVALRFALIAGQLDAAFPEGSQERKVVATGGGLLRSPTWIGIMADVLGRPVAASGVAEASSRGAALLALEALCGTRIEDTSAPVRKVYEPDLERHERYSRALARQRKLYKALIDPIPGSDLQEPPHRKEAPHNANDRTGGDQDNQ